MSENIPMCYDVIDVQSNFVLSAVGDRVATCQDRQRATAFWRVPRTWQLTKHLQPSFRIQLGLGPLRPRRSARPGVRVDGA